MAMNVFVIEPTQKQSRAASILLAVSMLEYPTEPDQQYSNSILDELTTEVVSLLAVLVLTLVLALLLLASAPAPTEIDRAMPGKPKLRMPADKAS